tara:strand:+ start:864 stop:1109 length:246 start_codon:yes stop_codon:yes gene_type:complete
LVILFDRLRKRGENMTTYSCTVGCGMAINGLTCAQCGTELQPAILTKDDGSTVSISKCPKECGKIKSPMCCGQDMAHSNEN